MKKSFAFICFLCAVTSCWAQIEIPVGRFQIDETIKLIVSNRLPSAAEIPSNYVRMDSKNFTFSASPGTPSYGTKYTVTNGGNSYSLYFTELALVDISLNGGASIDNIIRDSDINGVVRVTDKTGTYSHLSNMGIRIRGASSANFPKKSYRVTLRNADYTANKDDAFLGLRSDKRWLMLAMWNEELRFNNVVSHQLWRDIHTLYYLASEPQAIASIRTKYAEAFVNKRYRGVYAFTEDMDRKQLKLKNQANGGELYKGEDWGGATTFDKLPAMPSAPTELWGGWEMKYPDWEVGNWTNLHQFTDFVKNSTDATFLGQIGSKINVDSFIDYFLYLNLIYANDNSGKNTFIARYQTTDPYFIIPWDLDGAFGYSWTGNASNRTGEILTNNLYDRLFKLNPGDFKNKLATRWFTLRQNQFSLTYLNNMFDTNKNFLETNNVYTREYLVYQSLYNVNSPNYQLSNRNNALTYVKNWTKDRTEMLDYYYSPMLTNQAGCNFNISAAPSQSKVLPSTSLSLAATCQGANCAGTTYQWSLNSVVVGSAQVLNVTAPASYGMYTYNLQVSKASCPTKLLKTSYIVNNGAPKVSLSFSMWTPGPVGTRTKIRDLQDGDKIFLGDLPPLVNWFITMNDDQISNPTGSNYVNFTEFRLNRPEYLNYGWGPENVASTDGGPFGLFGREGGEAPTAGTHQIRGRVFNNNAEITNTVVNFTISTLPLPVKLSEFKVIAEGRTALLNWQTTEEVNSDRFEIEHSLSGKNWNVIGTVAAQNESSHAFNYSYVHKDPEQGLNYYRLHMIDTDGSSAYSSIKSITLESDDEQDIIYPNPVADKIFLKDFSDLEKVEVVSDKGNVLMKISQGFEKGISLKSLTPGTYIVRIISRNGNIKTKHVVFNR